MVAVQEISARIGRTTCKGLAGNLRAYYPAWLTQTTVILLFAANTLNIGADLGAMAEASRLMAGAVPVWIWVVLFGGVCIAGQIVFQHDRYASILRWLTLSLFAYFASLMMVRVPWRHVLGGLLWPTLSFHLSFWIMVVAIFGTTISPYLFFWQASQEAEDTIANPARSALNLAPDQGPRALARIRLDTIIGMGFSNLVALAILITTAATLRRGGVHEISSAAQAAEALRPVAGEFAFALFALGIIGTGLLSVPVLAGSAAYAVGEAWRLPVGLSKKPGRAKGFYITMVAATGIGAAGNVFSLNPMTALVWAAVINGIVAVPVMTLVMLMSRNVKVMGRFRISKSLAVVGWLATALMTAAAAGLIVSSVVS